MRGWLVLLWGFAVGPAGKALPTVRAEIPSQKEVQ